MFSSLCEWPLSATILTGFLFPALRNARKGEAAFRSSNSHSSGSPSSFHDIAGAIGLSIRGLKLRWISAREFTSLHARFCDLIVIDLREGDQWAPLPVPESISTLRIRKYELAQVLEHFPTDRIIVFFGVTELSALIIESSPIVKGSASVYVLNSQAGKEEIA
jgi:hypothetical protein